jgi:hypothetical protein
LQSRPSARENHPRPGVRRGRSISLISGERFVTRFPAGCVLTACLVWSGCPGAAFSPPADNAPAAPAPNAAAPAADGAPAPEQPPEPAAEPSQPAAEPDRPNALQREAVLVDRRAYLEAHPESVELEKNVIDANDPFTASAQGYFAAVSSLTKSAYEHDLRLQKALNNDKWPSFDAYKAILDMHGVKLKGLKKNQVYAYDDQTGKISILELPEAPAGN